MSAFTVVNNQALGGVAMAPDSSFEEELVALIEDARKERRKLEERLLTLQRAVEGVDERIAAHQVTLDAYRAKYGLPRIDIVQAAAAGDEATEYFGISPKQMVRLWADKHDDTIIMKDACRFLAAAGLFTDERQAAGTLYSTAKRMSDFERVGRGIFRRKVRPVVPTNVRPMGGAEVTFPRTEETVPGQVSEPIPERASMGGATNGASRHDLEDLPF
jgi:hypothetical protein